MFGVVSKLSRNIEFYDISPIRRDKQMEIIMDSFEMFVKIVWCSMTIYNNEQGKSSKYYYVKKLAINSIVT